ncbi:hypothetical protein CN335_21440 [Bacillus thuringiensis]|uniref:hypothetical protein n=1 Tax=Bacillus thuringiensis TaxID=1428 RepID=UPI000BF4DECB|nr:hypothetical protein [Bacillus thuringiensis]PFF33229.1 hypothetical protein CN335_21440 [Bacillus thuringiensis]PFT16903.1 hypothetical protein COK83_10255 [Bacillus thuringiensis]
MAKLDNVKVVNENTVEYNGFVYGLVTGDAKAADVIKASEQELDVTEGGFYLVVDIDEDNDIVFKDNVDDSNYFNQGEHSVFRKSHAITTDKLTVAEGVVKIELPDGTKLQGTPSDLEKITRKLQEMQAEQGSSEEVNAEVEDGSESVSERLQVGDYAKVVEEDSHSAKVGDIVKIFVDDEDNQPFKCEDLQGKELRYPWFYERGLVKATDEEVLEAKQSLLEEGDFARVIANTTSHHFEIGTVVKLDDYAEETDAFTAYYIDGSDFWRIYRSDLEPLTKEEAEHIEREAEEEKKAKAEREKWAAIGREVGEIKDGDVVKVIGKGSSDHKIGDVGEVSDSSKCLDGQYSFRVNTESLKFVNGLGSELVELIVPVEQRFDTVG